MLAVRLYSREKIVNQVGVPNSTYCPIETSRNLTLSSVIAGCKTSGGQAEENIAIRFRFFLKTFKSHDVLGPLCLLSMIFLLVDELNNRSGRVH